MSLTQNHRLRDHQDGCILAVKYQCLIMKVKMLALKSVEGQCESIVKSHPILLAHFEELVSCLKTLR